MSAKPDSSTTTAPMPAGAGKTDAAPAGAAPAAGAAKGRSALMAWIPAIAALLVAPVATWGVVQFVVLPRLVKQLSAAPVAEAAAEAAPHEKGGKEGKEGKEGAPNYEFQNVVVNLSGTMGTRYLKTSFLVTGTDPNIKATFEAKKAQLMDVTLNVLSSLTLADIEEPGAKNVIREKLVGAYNQALGRKVAEQVYFSDFVVQ
jgi:flagellar protein FliL